MSEEENKTIEKYKKLVSKLKNQEWISVEEHLSVPEGELILNLIEKQQKEIEKKDKIIDEMAGYLAIIRDCPNADKGANIDCENRCSTDDDIYAECWKLYFERKVENER